VGAETWGTDVNEQNRKDQWRIVIEAEGEGPPVYVRFRAWGIRVVSMSQEPRPAAAEGEGKHVTRY
jgi:hypothetical protein